MLWAARTAANSVGAFDRRSLQPIADVVLAGTVRDIAGAERQAIAALVDAVGSVRLTRIDERRQISDIATPGLNEQAFLVARVANRWVVAEPALLRWAQAEDPSAGWADLPLTSLGHGAGLAVAFLAAFPPVGVLLACSVGVGAAERLVVLGPDGEVLDDEPLPAALGTLHGIAGTDSSVWLASDTGLWSWDLAAGTGTGEASFAHGPAFATRGETGLRAEIQADLPPGATLLPDRVTGTRQLSASTGDNVRSGVRARRKLRPSMRCLVGAAGAVAAGRDGCVSTRGRRPGAWVSAARRHRRVPLAESQ